MQWCVEKGLSGAVWTDLEPNFTNHTGKRFSLPAATDYLQTLDGENLAEAYRYIQNAPQSTDTPLLRSLAENDWWQSLG